MNVCSEAHMIALSAQCALPPSMAAMHGRRPSHHFWLAGILEKDVRPTVAIVILCLRWHEQKSKGIGFYIFYKTEPLLPH